MGRTRKRFRQDVAAVLRRLDPPVVESACRDMLPRIVVVDLDVLRACPVAMIVDDGLGTGRIGKDRRRAWLGNPSSPRKLRRKTASAPASLAAMYSDSGVERATVEMVYDFLEIAAPPMRNT